MGKQMFGRAKRILCVFTLVCLVISVTIAPVNAEPNNTKKWDEEKTKWAEEKKNWEEEKKKLEQKYEP